LDKKVVLTCQDWGYILPRRIVTEIYEDQTPSDILADVFTKYASEITTTNVDATATQISITFDYMSVSDVIEQLMAVSPDWHYYIDSDKDLHYFYQYESDMAAITGAKIKLDSLRVNYSGIEHFNRVWIVGTKQADETAIDVYYTSDGTQRYYGPLPYEPAELSIYLTPSGLPEYELAIAAEQNDDGSSYEMLYDEKNRNFYFPTYQDPSSFTGTLRANFKPVRQFIEYFENASDIATYGLFEKVIKNRNVTDRLEARRFGKAEVKRSSEVKRTINFESDHDDILDCSIGQRSLVNITNYISNAYFIVTAKTTSINKEHTKVYVEMKEL